MTDTSLQFAESDWAAVLARESFVELDAHGRAEALLDAGSMRVLLGPFDRLESPWLEPQEIVPQSDDGVVLARGTVSSHPVVVISIEQGFQGGGTGEVSGAKISQALTLAARDALAGSRIAAILLFETGGVRLQEANLGLNAVAEICSAVLDLRSVAQVIGVVAGTVGSFGGVSIAAGLCNHLIVTPQARIGLNGPEVIEQEAGVGEFDSNNKALIWSIYGGEQRALTGLADELVADDVGAIRSALATAVAAAPATAGTCRSERLDVLSNRLALLNPTDTDPRELRETWGPRYEIVSGARLAAVAVSPGRPAASSRGAVWLRALARTVAAVTGSVLRGETEDTVFLAVVPDLANPFPRARQGQVGLIESLALAEQLDAVVTADADTSAGDKRGIVAIVDLPSQAYGRVEETAGLHQAIAAAVDAYHRARNARHPIVALVVGQALSGGFLAHGLQANQLLALDDPGVEIHAMHKAAAARITQRTVDELDRLAKTVTPISYDVRDWASLGFCDGLLEVSNADDPGSDDVQIVADALAEAIVRARSGPLDLSNRFQGTAAASARAASIAVRDRLAEQW